MSDSPSPATPGHNLWLPLDVLHGSPADRAQHELLWENLYGSVDARLRHFLRRWTGDLDDLDDLAAKTWERAYERREGFSGRGPFDGWLLRIARSIALDQYRSEAARKRRENALPVDLEMGDSLEHLLEGRLDLERLSFVLTDEEREFLRLVGEGLTHPEIAEVLGLRSPGASEARKFRIIRKIRRAYPEISEVFYSVLRDPYTANVPRVVLNLSMVWAMAVTTWEDLPEPRPEDYAASAANRWRFEKVLADGRVLRELGNEAELIRGDRPFESYEGLSLLLDAVLPREREALDRISEALHLHPVTLGALRTGERIATEVVAEPMVRLCRYLGMEMETALVLIERDLENHPEAVVGREGIDALRKIWKAFYT